MRHTFFEARVRRATPEHRLEQYSWRSPFCDHNAHKHLCTDWTCLFRATFGLIAAFISTEAPTSTRHPMASQGERGSALLTYTFNDGPPALASPWALQHSLVQKRVVTRFFYEWVAAVSAGRLGLARVARLYRVTRRRT